MKNFELCKEKTYGGSAEIVRARIILSLPELTCERAGVSLARMKGLKHRADVIEQLHALDNF